MVAESESVVTVFGANDPSPGDEAYETARAVGRTLAELGYAIANGGYGGSMEASSRGAKEAGGRTIGVPCELWSPSPNRFTDRCIVTRTLLERLQTLIELGTGGYVVLPGATGTLVELATGWEMLCKGFLSARPLVCVGRFWQPVIDLVTKARPGAAERIQIVDQTGELSEHFPPAPPRLNVSAPAK